MPAVVAIYSLYADARDARVRPRHDETARLTIVTGAIEPVMTLAIPHV
jgi:hypothetical protein